MFDSSTDGTSLRCKYLFCKLVTSFAAVQRRAGGLNWKITVYSRLSTVRLEKLLEWHVDENMFYFVLFFFDLSLLFCMWNEWCITSAVGSKPLWKLVSQRFDKHYSCQLQVEYNWGIRKPVYSSGCWMEDFNMMFPSAPHAKGWYNLKFFGCSSTTVRSFIYTILANNDP